MKKGNKGITLIALIITIVIMLILIGIVLNLTIGEYGIIKKAQTAKEQHEQQAAKERLEIELANLYADKQVNLEYNENEYLEKKLMEKGFTLKENIVIVDGWKFQVDRTVPKIEIVLGKVKDDKAIQLQWIEIVGEKSDKITIEEILQNKELINKLMNSNEAVEFMIENQEIFDEVLKSANAMEELGKNRNAVKIVLKDENALIKVKNSEYAEHLEKGSIQVPKMTSNTSPYGKASCSSHYQNGNAWDAWIAFNERSDGDGWYATASPAWIQYEFTEEVCVYKIKIYAQIRKFRF